MKSILEFKTAVGFDKITGTMWQSYIFPTKDSKARVCYGMTDGTLSLTTPYILMMNRIVQPILRSYDQEIEARRRASGP